jgi:hypothetical protein
MLRMTVLSVCVRQLRRLNNTAGQMLLDVVTNPQDMTLCGWRQRTEVTLHDICATTGVSTASIETWLRASGYCDVNI